jgi:hypothetical protein
MYGQSEDSVESCMQKCVQNIFKASIDCDCIFMSNELYNTNVFLTTNIL